MSQAFFGLGCAEGYYAVGLALRLPRVRVFAYDIDPEARRARRAIARRNGATARVQVGSHCDALALLGLHLGNHAFVLCDYEGWERWILARCVAHEFASHDFLIETHDFIHEGQSRSAPATHEQGDEAG